MKRQGPGLTPPPPLPQLSTWMRHLDLPLPEDKLSGWRPYHIMRGMTPCVADLNCHVSVLSPGKTPHEPHVHAEEEILIMLSGEADIILSDDISQTMTRQRIGPGAFVYYPAYRRHTLHNPGTQSATYLMFKWQSAPLIDSNSADHLPVQFCTCGRSPSTAPLQPFVARDVLNGPTRYLRRFNAHFTQLQPKAGYSPHCDSHDVAIVTIDGTIETLGQQAGPNSVIFCAAGERHGMKNIGTSPAAYVVFEFHGDNPGFSESRNFSGSLRKALARIYLAIGRLAQRCSRPVPG